jgi:uncharacterized SAM-binding protein YcdF (DUF218 family)
LSHDVRRRSYMKIYIKMISALAALLLLAGIFHAPLLKGIGKALVRKDVITPADCIVVLAGDATGERMNGAISLFKNHYAENIIFWHGSPHFIKTAFRQFKANGVTRDKVTFSTQELAENNTYGEALVNISLLQQKHFQSFILVTSDYHSSRAGRVYASLAAKNRMIMKVYPVQEKGIDLNGWWKNSDSRKEVLSEWKKTVWYLLKY